MKTQGLESEKKPLQDLEDVIARALKKVGSHDEDEIRHYLPMPGGGYMHHFTWKKKKLESPQDLGRMIEESILKSSKPMIVEPKKRASKGPRKRLSSFGFTFQQVNKLIQTARQSGNEELVSLLSSQRSLKSCKKALIAAIRNHQVSSELWDAYVEAVQREGNRSK